MRLVRIGLLVLLAALLPLRGAMAAAMLCPMAAGPQGHDLTLHHGAADHHAHEMAGCDGHADGDPGSPQHHRDGEGHNKCSLCASCCSAVPLAGRLPSLPEPFDAAPSFPALSAPAPTFLAGGQERPPRSI